MEAIPIQTYKKISGLSVYFYFEVSWTGTMIEMKNGI